MKSKVKKIMVYLVVGLLLLGNAGYVLPNVNEQAVVEAATNRKLSKKKVTLYVGNTVTLKLSGVNSKKVSWSVKNKKVAKVNKKGVVSGLKKGKTQIIAKYKGKKYKCTVTVKSAKISYKKLTLREGQGFSLDVAKSSGKVKWTSSNPKVAKVNANGYIIPLSKGTTKIKATIYGETYTCNLKVVDSFSEDDFVFDEPDDDGYTNYIDYSTANGSSWYWYWNTADDSYKGNRGINIGDTYEDFEASYGYCETEIVKSNDRFSSQFINSSYPRTKVKFEYRDHLTHEEYYKSFYFDRKGTVVLITWHR